MKTILLLFTLFLFHNTEDIENADFDYRLLNQVLPDITGIENNKNQNIYEKPIAFNNQDSFFTKKFLENFTYPVIGVDSEKVKTLIKILDFEYLAKQKVPGANWDFSKLKYKITPYREDTGQLNGQVQFKIARPVYTKDKKTAFIYYYRTCGSMDCSITGVKVYKYIKGKWVYYVQVPLTVS